MNDFITVYCISKLMVVEERKDQVIRDGIGGLQADRIKRKISGTYSTLTVEEKEIM